MYLLANCPLQITGLWQRAADSAPASTYKRNMYGEKKPPGFNKNIVVVQEVGNMNKLYNRQQEYRSLHKIFTYITFSYHKATTMRATETFRNHQCMRISNPTFCNNITKSISKSFVLFAT